MIFYTFWVVRAICWGTAFSMRKVRFCGQTINPLPHAAPPRPCHTIKTCEWKKMDCSLPSHSVVLLLDGIIGPRWQAGRQGASSSSIWPSGRWSGPRVPGLGSLQMCRMLLLSRNCRLPLQGIFTWSRSGPEALAGSYQRRRSYAFPSGVIFYTKTCGPKGIYEYRIRVISLETQDAKLRDGAGGTEANHTVSLLLRPFLFQLFLSYWNQILINTKGSSKGDKMRKELSVTWDERELSGWWPEHWTWELEHVHNLSLLQQDSSHLLPPTPDYCFDLFSSHCLSRDVPCSRALRWMLPSLGDNNNHRNIYCNSNCHLLDARHYARFLTCLSYPNPHFIPMNLPILQRREVKLGEVKEGSTNSKQTMGFELKACVLPILPQHLPSLSKRS